MTANADSICFVSLFQDSQEEEEEEEGGKEKRNLDKKASRKGREGSRSHFGSPFRRFFFLEFFILCAPEDESPTINSNPRNERHVWGRGVKVAYLHRRGRDSASTTRLAEWMFETENRGVGGEGAGKLERSAADEGWTRRGSETRISLTPRGNLVGVRKVSGADSRGCRLIRSIFR